MAAKPQDLREPSSSPPSGDRLNSWKEIAAYLNCSESTVRRWEEEGLPVHRHLHKTKAAIYAYKTEIDAWWRDGHARLKEVEEPREGAFTARSRFWKTPWLWAGLAVSFGMALVAGNLGGLRDRLLRKSPPPRIQSLAVLPLQNLSHDPEQEYFADGMTDALITDLAQIGPLRVISRTSSMQYKQTNKSLPEIARELNVDGVVEGTVQRSGDRVRITAQLIYGPSDKHLWARSYERDSRDVLALQQEVASAIADEIEIKVTPQKPIHLASAHPVNVQAHDSYLRGLQQLRSETPEDIERAIEYFQQAVTHDSNYALAYSGLADAYHEQSTLFRAPLEVLPKAKAAAVRAIELDDSLAEAHASLGYVKLEFDWDWSGAEREYRRALELNSNEARALSGQAIYFLTLHQTDEAIASLRRAEAVDPLAPGNHMSRAYLLFNARRYEQAIEAGRQSGDERAMALSYAELGRSQETIAAADQAFKTANSPVIVAQLASAYAKAGKAAKARAMLSKLEAQARQRYVCGFNMACLYSALGEKEKAFGWLEKAYLARSD